jgi:2-oxoisovalerate dehydrogenase E2 component (dihydrolipoyl transacylase)
MAAMTMIQALRSAMDVMLERDGRVVVFGEDVGYFGGVFRCTEGLQAKYGTSRVFDTPIAEGGIVGIAVGMGAYGLRPVAEIQFADYSYPAYDQIVSGAARLRYRSAGDFTAPITIRMPCGGGIYGGQTHSQSPEALFTHVCGLRTVMPSNPYDAKGLLIASRDRLGHAVPACPGVGLLPRPGTCGRGLQARSGGMMGIHVIKMPDIGEGIAEVELVAWHVQPGDTVAEDQVLADVMTDKANVEIPSPVAGRVLALGGQPGDVLPVGAELIRIEVEGVGNVVTVAAPAVPLSAPAPAPAAAVEAQPAPPPAVLPTRGTPAAASKGAPTAAPVATRTPGDKPIASPAVRRRAWELGIEVQVVQGSGSAGRILHEDLETYAARARVAPAAGSERFVERHDEQALPVIGLRRKIAQKMQESKRRIPHFSYVEEVDVTELETLRAQLNSHRASERGRLKLLPLLVRAVVLAARRDPQFNARFDDDAGVVTRYGAVHLGVATQIEGGLLVPVLRHAEARDLSSCAAVQRHAPG